jgi:beta-lactamase class C
MNSIKHITMLFFALTLAGPAAAVSVDKSVQVLAGGLARLEADPDGVGVAVCVARSDRILLLDTRGRRGLDGDQLVGPETRFRIASLSKGFASTVTAQLVAEGKLSWSEPVAKHIESFVLKDPAETRRTELGHLLSHRIGLPPYAYDNVLEAGRSVESIVRRFREIDPICGVGTCYGYQNIGYNLVTDLIEDESGIDYERQVQARIFEPLGMGRSGLGRTDLITSDNWAQPHVGRGSYLRGAPVKEDYYRLPASAGVNASIQDMCQWLRAQLGGHSQVLSDVTRELFWTPIVETRRELRRGRWRRARLLDAQYGYGWRIYDYQGERVIFHAGSVQGYGAQIAIVPRLNVGVVGLWNSQSRRPWGIAPTFLDALLGLKPEDWLRLEEMTTDSNAKATAR